MATYSFAERVGSAARKSLSLSKQSSWYTPFMAAASQAIAERLPLVDFVLDVRDARVGLLGTFLPFTPSSAQCQRIPLSSEYGQLRCLSSSPRRVIVLNKMDLVKPTILKDWIRYFQANGHTALGVNSHNKDDIQEMLNFLQSQVRALNRVDPEKHTITMMLVGIPNVGKSALANSLHQIGRISAAEKGKLRHAVVSPLPGETKSISSLKIASHPSIYILDSPGVLPPVIADTYVLARLSLTGALSDCLAGEKELARYCLSIINSNNEFRKWEKKLLASNCGRLSIGDEEVRSSSSSGFGKMRKKSSFTDHTRDFMVNKARRYLLQSITTFKGDMEEERDLLKLIELEIEALMQAFCLSKKTDEDDCHLKACVKLLNLYRTGRLGRYTLDIIPGGNDALL